MLVREIELENFLSHQSESISLPEEGIFLLSGDSGSGKSSIVVDAIAYALFGAVATRSRKQEMLVNRDSEGQPMSVRVLFQLGEGEELIVARGVSNGRSSGAWAKAYEPDPQSPGSAVLLAEGAVAVARLLRRKLGGMSWRQFYAAFVARQSEIALLTTKTGAERKKLIQRMLGMRELEKSAELISAGLRRAQAEVDQLEFSLGGLDLDTLTRERAEASERERIASERAEAARAQIAQNTDAVEKLEAEMEPIRVAERAAERARTLGAEIELWSERAELHSRAEAARAQIEEQSQQVDECSQRVDFLRDEYNRLSARLKAARRRAELESARRSAAERVPEKWRALSSEDLAARTASLSSEIRAAEERIADAQQRGQRLRESGDCYACARPFESEHEHSEAVQAIERELEESERSREKLREELSELQRVAPALRELHSASSELDRAEEALADPKQVEEELERVRDQGVEQREKLEQLRQRHAELSGHARQNFPEAAQKLSELRAELSELGDQKPAQMGEREAQLSELVRETEQLRGSLPEIEAEIRRAEVDRESAAKKLEGLEHETETLQSLRERALAYERTQTLLRGYQQHLAAEIRPALEEIGSEMLQQISSGKMRALRIGEDSYEIEVEFSSGYTVPAAMLSGGEEIRTNLCLRLALTRLVSQRTGVPVGFLVLDEPLPSQDPGHVDRILELLESLKPFYRQQFIISHVGDLRNADAINHIIELDETLSSGQRVKLLPA